MMSFIKSFLQKLEVGNVEVVEGVGNVGKIGEV